MSLQYVENLPTTPDSLVFLLHGYGADKNDLIGLAPHLQHALPNTGFISPDAVFACEAGFGRQWFGLDAKLDKDSLLNGLNIAKPYLDDFIQTHMQRLGIRENKVALLGFSQGTMMALHCGLRWHTPFAGIVGFSGMLVGTDILADEITAKPPVLLVHGDQDEIINVEFLNIASEALVKNKVCTDTLLCPGLAHGIDNEGLLTATQFLQNNIITADMA